MSEFSLVANNTKLQKTGRYLHTEDPKNTIVIVVSVVWLLVTTAFSWEISRQCGRGCASGEYLLMLLPVVGVMLLAYGCRLIYLRKRLGGLVLQLPLPLHTGCKSVPATLYFTEGLGKGMRHPAATYPLALEVVCTHVDNSDGDTSTKILWSQKFKDGNIAHGTGSVDFTFSLPANLPGSGNLGRSEIKIIWKLQLKMLGTKVSFVLPVRLLATN